MIKVFLSTLGLTNSESHYVYLGLPTFMGETKWGCFEMFSTNYNCGKGRCFRLGGRWDFDKGRSPSYIYVCYESVQISFFTLWRDKIPCLLILVGRRCWWKEDSLGVGWDKLCLPKVQGGVGFRDISMVNRALLAKQCWRIITMPNSLRAGVGPQSQILSNF